MVQPDWPKLTHCLKLRDSVQATEAAIAQFNAALKELLDTLKKAGVPSPMRSALERTNFAQLERLGRLLEDQRKQLKKDCNWTVR